MRVALFMRKVECKEGFHEPSTIAPVEVGLLFRITHLVNSILLNSEVWYGVTKSDVEELESVDHVLLRRMLEAPASTPIPMLYLELGVIPFRYIIISRRLMYLQYLLKQEEEALLKKFFLAQIENPVRGDWIQEVKKNLDDVKIDYKLCRRNQ